MKDITLEMFNLAKMYIFNDMHKAKKIKVTSKFSAYLEETCHTDFLDVTEKSKYDGTWGQFESIPIEIDDTIENEYYELVYEEENNNDI